MRLQITTCTWFVFSQNVNIRSVALYVPLQTTMYNDLFVYSIKHSSWKLLKIPGAPPPRSSHQVQQMTMFIGCLH